MPGFTKGTFIDYTFNSPPKKRREKTDPENPIPSFESSSHGSFQNAAHEDSSTPAFKNSSQNE